LPSWTIRRCISRIGLVKLPQWSRGRIGLLGDAAYCASPISGLSTTLALTGAYILAGELTQATTSPSTADRRSTTDRRGADVAGVDVAGALARYEQRMRPLVARAQTLPPGSPQNLHPLTPEELRRFQDRMRAAGQRPTSDPTGTHPTAAHGTPAAEAITAPDYPGLRTPATRRADPRPATTGADSITPSDLR